MSVGLSLAVARHAARGIWSRPTVSWMLYDLANTMFSFAILSFYFPRWVVSDAGGNDALLSYAITIPMALMLVSAPVLGALSDQTPRRMPYLILTTLGCVTFTALLGTGGLIPSLVFFAIANFFFQTGLIFYDALLPEVSTEENRGRVSGYGVGIGYLGSFIMLAVGSLLLASGGERVETFRATAVLFLLFALPCFLFVRERPRRHTRPLSRETVAEAFRAVAHTARRVRHYPGLGRFLLARALYNDVANTLTTFMAIYVMLELGFSEAEVTVIGAIIIVASVAGGFMWGRVLDRIGPKRTLTVVLTMWMITILLGVLIPILALPHLLFYVVGIMAGVSLGGMWASDRMLLLRLAPPRYLGQFYGLYSMVGRFGQLIGPFLWGLVAVTLGLGRPAALFSLFFVTAIAFAILRPVKDAAPAWENSELV
ncbi:MAG: MFS transporter [Ardenticatenaceae bacterium]